MREKVQIFFINILLFFIIFFVFDFFIFAKFYHPDKKIRISDAVLNEYKYFYTRKINKNALHNLYVLGKFNFYRMTRNMESNKKPILLFGCSYLYNSHKIFDETNRSSDIFARYTGRPVYNRARDGFGPPSILFQVENNDFYKRIKKPQYIIYTFIEDHVKRLYLPANFTSIDSYDIFYKEQDNSLKKIEENKLFKKISLIMFFKHYLYRNNIFPYNKTIQEKNSFFLKHMIEIKKHIEKHWGNTKFIIFAYEQNSPTIKLLQNELENEGFIVIYRNEICPFSEEDLKYHISEDDRHPTPKAWEEIVPKLMEKIEKL